MSFRREGPSENIEYCLCPYDKKFKAKVGLYFCMFSSPEYPSVESLCFFNFCHATYFSATVSGENPMTVYQVV